MPGGLIQAPSGGTRESAGEVVSEGVLEGTLEASESALLLERQHQDSCLHGALDTIRAWGCLGVPGEPGVGVDAPVLDKKGSSGRQKAQL